MKKIKKFLIIGLLIIIYYLINKKFQITIPCLFHKITNWYCPGCGITRLIFSLIHLDFYQAFRYNPLVFILGILYGCYCIISLVIKIKLPKCSSYILIVIVILFGILRNIELFSYLKPTVIR